MPAEKKRQYRNSAQWRGYVERYPESGLSVADFCKKHGLYETGFYTWRKRLREQVSAGFIRLDPEISAAEEYLTITTPNGFRIEVPVKLAPTAGVDTAQALVRA
ncbi:MAG: transposase [Candidatus Omnitrophica bacterium]|nr:transposase [Candidatus Omnitrophota bacterium]